MNVSPPSTRIAPALLACALLSLTNNLTAQDTGGNDASTNQGVGDLMIGEGRNSIDWAGETTFSRRGKGQGIMVDLRGRRLTNFHFGSDNDTLYPYQLRVTSQVKRTRKIRTRIRHLNSNSGGSSKGSKNVTGAMRRGGYSTEVSPGETAIFKVGLRYRMDDRQPKTVMRFSSRNEGGTRIDSVKAKVKPKK